MKMTKTFNSILACGLLLMSIGSAFGQTADERKLELVLGSGHSSHINSVAFSNDGKLLATAGNSFSNDKIKIWDVNFGIEIKLLNESEVAAIIIFSNDDKTLLSYSYDAKKIKLCESIVEI